MREGQFIQQNKNRWTGYETGTDDPDELARQFTCLVDDLSYAKTFFPQGNTVRYLNNLASNLYLSIYRNRQEKGNRLISFWTTELPLILYRQRRLLLYSFLFFITFVAIGLFSASQEPAFVNSVLGDSYVSTTEANIAAGDPFGIYKHDNTLAAFFDLSTHNIIVAFITFLLGVLVSTGTIWMLLKNGLMLGVFDYLFIKHGLGTKFILVVFIHGTLEISAIVIAGMAGMVLGNSVLFPGTRTRLQSLIRGAKDGTKIMVGLIPVFFAAGFFEIFVTRYTDMPLALSLLILIGSLSFILLYFVVYPARLARKRTKEFNYDPLAAED